MFNDSQLHRGFTRMGWIVTALVVVLATTMLSQTERFPSINEVCPRHQCQHDMLTLSQISEFCFHIALTFLKLYIKIGYLVLDAAEGAIMDAGYVLD